MSAVRMRSGADLRRHAVWVVLVTLLIGAIGATMIAFVAGGLRTASAYPRYREATKQPEAMVFSCMGVGPFPEVAEADLAALPGVTQIAAYRGGPANIRDAASGALLFSTSEFDPTVLAPLTPSDLAITSLRVVAGRMPNPKADEVVVGWGVPQNGVPRPHIGEAITVGGAVLSGFGGGGSGVTLLKPVPATVVGVVLTPNSLKGDDFTVIASASVMDKIAAQPKATFCSAYFIQLRDGSAGMPAVSEGIRALNPAIVFITAQQEMSYVNTSTHLRSIIYVLFGLLVGLVGFTIVGQAVVRRTLLAGTDDPVLRAVGMTRGERIRSAMALGVLVTLAGTVLAFVGSVAVSGFFPTGLARFIEPNPGVSVNWAVILPGLAIIAFGMLAATAIPAWRQARMLGSTALGTAEFGGRPSRLASAVARLGPSPALGAGTRLALEPGHGATATPVRSAIAGIAITVAAVVGGLVFAASMGSFLSTPADYGIGFQVASGNPYAFGAFQQKVIPVWTSEPAFSQVSVGNFQHVVTAQITGRSTETAVWGISPVKGAVVGPTILVGRWPSSPDEVALGKVTMRAIGAAIGDRVTLVLGTRSGEYTVVGTAVFGEFGFGPGLGDGAGTTFEGLQRLAPDVEQSLVAANWAPGVDKSAAIPRLKAAGRAVGAAFKDGAGDTAGVGAAAAGQSRRLPLLLSLFLAVAAAATLIHVLLTSIRRRRRDLAILTTLGFKRRQLLATVMWQSVTIALSGLLIGMPIGIALGRWAWVFFADRLGVGGGPKVPWLAVGIFIPATVVLAMLIALGPALVARRTAPAQVLKAE